MGDTFLDRRLDMEANEMGTTAETARRKRDKLPPSGTKKPAYWGENGG